MKFIKCKKGVSLVEIILAVAIFAAITFPLLSVFVQSINVDKKSDDVLNANYISQDYLENLDKETYITALQKLPTNVMSGNYSYTAKITPYGNLNYYFGQPCNYIHIIITDTAKTLCVMPDGKWYEFSSIPSSFSITMSYNSYTFTGGYTSITGDSKYNYCAVIVNAMKKPNAMTSAITLNGNCEAALYCTEAGSGEITFSGGDSHVYKDLIVGDKSLIFVSTAVYDPSGEKVIATSDSYINIKNW